MKNNNETDKKKLLIAITGASGARLGINLLEKISKIPVCESHLIISKNARMTIKHETSFAVKTIQSLATRVYESGNVGAKISSGSYKTAGMIIAPCSMKTLAGIKSGYSDNLILRAADVSIKEGRPLVLLPRETPLSPIHLENMLYLAKIGVVILPPVLTYYNMLESIEDMSDHISGKVLRIFGFELDEFRCWDGM